MAPLDGALVGMDRLVSELCKKIFNFSVADLELTAQLLCSLPPDEMLKVGQISFFIKKMVTLRLLEMGFCWNYYISIRNLNA